MNIQSIKEALGNYNVYPYSKYFENPVIQEVNFNSFYPPNGSSMMFRNLSFQVSQIKDVQINWCGNLDAWLEHGYVGVMRNAKDSPLLQNIYPELKERSISLKELFKQFYLIEESDKFTEEEKSVLLPRGYTENTKITKFKLPKYGRNYVDELYLIEDLGYTGQEFHQILVFMENYPDNILSLAESDVVMLIEPADGGGKDRVLEILNSIQINQYP